MTHFNPKAREQRIPAVNDRVSNLLSGINNMNVTHTTFIKKPV